MKIEDNVAYGRLAYNETENIKRDILLNKVAYYYNSVNFYKENITAQSNQNIHAFEIEALPKTHLSLSVAIKLSDTAVLSDFKALVKVNGVVIKSIKTINAKNIYDVVNFVSTDKCKIEILTDMAVEVEFEMISIELSGNFMVLAGANTDLKIVYSEFSNQVAGINRLNGKDYLHVFNSASDLKNNFNGFQTSLKFFDKIFGFAFVNATVNNTVACVKNNNKIQLININLGRTLDIASSEDALVSMFYSKESRDFVYILTVSNRQAKLYQININTFLIYNETTFDFEFDCSQIDFFVTSFMQSAVGEFGVCAKLTSNKVLGLYFKRWGSEFKAFSNKTLIVADALNICYVDNVLTMFCRQVKNVKQLDFKVSGMGFARLKSVDFLNAKAGFYLSKDVPIIYYENTFS